MTMAWVIAQFALCAALIAVAGYVLSVSADRLADTYGWGRGWVGLALLATVTSLPELACGISAVVWVDAPNLAVGNVLGACVLNLLFLAVVDLLQRDEPMYRQASASHLLAAAFGVVMLGFVVISLMLGARAPVAFNLGLYSPVLLALYLLGLRCVFAHEGARSTPTGRGTRTSPTRDLRRFGAAALVVLAAGSWLPNLADELATQLGWSRSFVGTLFMAVVTTLPEVAVTLSALRLGALDMAIGNLLGSNLFNLIILAVDDLFYLRGPLLADASPVHVGTSGAAVMMTGLVIVGLVMRPRGRVLRSVSWISVGLLAAYGLNATFVFLHGA